MNDPLSLHAIARQQAIGAVRPHPANQGDPMSKPEQDAEWRKAVSRSIIRIAQHVHNAALGTLDLSDVDFDRVVEAADLAAQSKTKGEP